MWDDEREVETSDAQQDASVQRYSDEDLNSQQENEDVCSSKMCPVQLRDVPGLCFVYNKSEHASCFR
jgi:hypothetical protein